MPESHATTVWRRLSRITAVAVATVIGALATLAGGVLLLLLAVGSIAQSPNGRDWLAHEIEALLSVDGKTRAEIRGIGPGLPLRLAVERIELADADGPWLQARNLLFAWQPRALLRGRLRITEIGLGELHIARLPPAGEPSADAGGGMPQLPHLPLAVAINRLHIDDIQLDPPVTGHPLRLQVEGRLAAAGEGGMVQTALSVQPLDGGSGGVRVAADLDPRQETLKVDARIDEPAEGLLVTLLGVPSRPPLSVRLAGEGPLADWRGSLGGEMPGFGRLDADISLQRREDLRLEANGSTSLAPTLVPALAPALADPVRFELVLRQTAGKKLVAEHVSAAATGLLFGGFATLDPDQSTIDATVDLSVEEKALAADTLGPLRFAETHAHATLQGELNAPSVEASASILGIAAPGGRAQQFELQMQASPATTPAGATAITAQGRFSDLQLDSPPLRAALGDAPTLSLQADIDPAANVLTLHSLVLAGPATRLATQGTLAMASGDLAAKAELAFSDLRAIGTAAGLAAAGKGSIAVDVNGNTKLPAVQGTMQARTSGLATGIPAADALLGAEPAVETAFSWAASTGLDIPKLLITGRQLQGEGKATLATAPARLDAQLRLSVPNLAPLSAPLGSELKGSFVVDVTASGDPADPSAVVAARLRDAVAGGTRIADARAELRAANLVTRPNGRLTAEAASDLGPLSAVTAFSLEQNRRLRLDGLMARGAGIALSADLLADLQAKLAAGSIHVRSEAPQTGIRAADAEIIGPLQLDIRLTPAAGRQSIIAALNSGPLTFRQGGTEQARIAALSGDATITDAFALPHLGTAVQARDVVFGAQQIGEVRMTADGTSSRAHIGVSAAGVGAKSAEIEAGGTLSLADGSTRFDLDRLQGRVGGESMHLVHAARITASRGRTELSGLALDVGGGNLTADARLGPGETFANIRIQGLPVRLARLFSPAAPAAGTLDMTTALRTERTDTVGEIGLHLNGIDLAEVGVNDAHVNARAELRLADRTLTVDSLVTGPQGSRIALAGHLPARLPAGQAAPVIDRTAPIGGTLTIDADLTKLSRLLALADQRIEGRLDGAFTIAGSLADPDLRGGLTLTDGLYEHFVTGTLLNHLSARIEPVDRRTLSLQVQGDDGGTGRVGVEGTAGLDSEGQLRADITVSAEAATLVRRDDVTAATNAQISYSSRNEPARLAGTVDTTEVNVRLVNRLPPSVVELPVIEIGYPRAGPATAGKQTAAAIALDLDLAVTLPRHVFVRGRGLESEWAGALSVTGTTAAPRISGSVNLVRGTFSFGSKRFDLQRGTITFTGGMPVDPMINAVAEYRSSNITAQINVSGFASKPEITITSQPPLPQSEVLAQVLFGKSTAKLGPVEAVQLALAAEALARGESTSEDVFSFARTLLGLDTLAVQPSSSGEGSSVAVGRYVGDRVYIGAEQGIQDGSQTGSVEIEVAPGISIESELGQTATSGTQGALGLKWKWDY